LYTLGHLRARQAFPPAIRFLRDEREIVRLRAAQALGRIGDRRAIPRLRPLVKDEMWTVRFAAAEALQRLGDKSGVAANVIPPVKPPPAWKE
jgi:HEAT repeat protein